MNRPAHSLSFARATLMLLLWIVTAPAFAQSGGKGPEVYRCVNERGEAYFQVGECPKTVLTYPEAVSAPRTATPSQVVAPPSPGRLDATPGANGLPPGDIPVPGVSSEDAHREQLRRRTSLKMLRTFMFGLVFGVVAKFRDRSFFVWFLIGVAVEFALVGAAVFN